MDEKRRPSLKTIICIVILVVIVAIALITTCILNAKRGELDDWKDKNDQIPKVSITKILN